MVKSDMPVAADTMFVPSPPDGEGVRVDLMAPGPDLNDLLVAIVRNGGTVHAIQPLFSPRMNQWLLLVVYRIPLDQITAMEKDYAHE